MIRLPYYHYLSWAGVLYVLIARMEVHESVESFSIGSNAGDIRSLAAYHHRHLSAVQEPDITGGNVVIVLKFFHEVLLPVLRHVLAEYDSDVIQGYFIELIIRDF